MAEQNDVLLPPNKTLCGYIFKCNHWTMPTCLEGMVFGLSEPYRNSVETITPGMPIFLYNFNTRRLHGVYEAVEGGGYNIDPTFHPDPQNPGRSLYPAQVKVKLVRECEPLTREITRIVMQNLRLPRKRFRLVLSKTESRMLEDAFLANQV